MTKVNRHRTYGTTLEWRIIAKALIEPGMGTGRPLLNRDLRKPVKLTRNARSVDVPSGFDTGRFATVAAPRTSD